MLLRLRKEIKIIRKYFLFQQIWQLLGCSTGLCSTIQIEQKLFDNLKSWDVRLGLHSTTKLTIVKHKINRTKSEK